MQNNKSLEETYRLIVFYVASSKYTSLFTCKMTRARKSTCRYAVTPALFDYVCMLLCIV